MSVDPVACRKARWLVHGLFSTSLIHAKNASEGCRKTDTPPFACLLNQYLVNHAVNFYLSPEIYFGANFYPVPGIYFGARKRRCGGLSEGRKATNKRTDLIDTQSQTIYRNEL